MTRLLRLVAFVIAVAGVIDPTITLSGASRARIALVTLRSAPAAADGIRERLARDLSDSYEIVPQLTSDAAAAIVIGDRYPERSDWQARTDAGVRPGVPDALRIATVTTVETAGPGVRIVGVHSPRDVPPATAIHLDAELEGLGVGGQTTDITAEIAGLEVGRASHRWTANDERWHAVIDAVPAGDPPYVVRVRLSPSLPGGFGGTGKPDTAETTSANPMPAVPGLSRPSTRLGAVLSPSKGRTTADVVVDIRRDPLRVEFYDPRPSWATTFLRRALEADARFQVATLSSTSRGVTTQTGGAVAPGDARLDGFDAVIVGGLDRLSAADARGLDRYIRERGGALVVVPDQRIDAGPARDLISGAAGSGRVRLEPPVESLRAARSSAEGPDLVERLLEQPAKLTVTAPAAPLQASELLVLRSLTPGSDIVARVPGSDGSPVIVSMPRGDGRLMLSGAMDAWRFRANDSAAFDRFWQSTIAGLALAAPPPIALSVDPPILLPGERGEVTVRVRSHEGGAVSASLDGVPIRLIPDAEVGVYRGWFVARETPGRSTVEVRAAAAQPLSASRTLQVQPDVHRVGATPATPLGLLSASHRGIDVTPEHLTDLTRFLRSAVASPRAPMVGHPMRSTWWIVPFALCLSAEWWIRRRRGLR